ncbi:unnamed protein product [Tilletia controversa]|nr:unnamed protein product [Tilletia controversa]
MDKLLFATLVALPKNDEDLIVCGTVYNTTDINFATLKMPAILNVTGKDFSLRRAARLSFFTRPAHSLSPVTYSWHRFNAKPVLHIHDAQLRANGDDADVDINPPNIHGVMQVICKDIKVKSYKCKARANDLESGNKIDSTFFPWREREQFKNVPWADDGTYMAFVGHLLRQEPVSSAITIDLLDSAWMTTPPPSPSTSASATGSPNRLKRRRIQAVTNNVDAGPSSSSSTSAPSSSTRTT